MARSTVFSYKGKEVDPRKVGQELNVRAVFTGKMIQRGDDLIIAAELVNAADGSRLWGEQYERRLTEVIKVQTEIAQRISEKLRLALTGEQKYRLTKRHTENAEAHQLYLKGRYYNHKYNEELQKKGLAYLKEATDLDPNYALAYAGLADAYYGLSNLYLPPQEAMPKSRAAAMKALELDETLAEAHTSLAVVKAVYDLEWDAAERAYARHMYGVLLMIRGRPNEALVELKRAQELDPLSPSIAVTAANPYIYAPPAARQYDRAIEELRKIIAVDPKFSPAHVVLGQAYEQKGMFEEAIAEMSRTRQLDTTNAYSVASLGHAYATAGKPSEARQILAELQEWAKRQHVSAFSLGLIYTGLGEKDQALAWLQKAYEVRDEDMLLIKVDPRFDGLRSDSRFTDLLRRMNLAP